jgi:hypothetical protein
LNNCGFLSEKRGWVFALFSGNSSVIFDHIVISDGSAKVAVENETLFEKKVHVD